MKKLTIISNEISAGDILWMCQQLTVMMVVVEVKLLPDRPFVAKPTR